MPFEMSKATDKTRTVETEIKFENLGTLKLSYRPNRIDREEMAEQRQRAKEAEDGGKAETVATFIGLVASWDAVNHGEPIPLTPEGLEEAGITEAVMQNIIFAVTMEATVGEAKGTRIRKL